MMAHMDQERARALMQAHDLDALLLCTPEDFYYGTGYSSGLSELYRQAPMAMALIPAKADIEPAILVPTRDAKAARRISGLETVYGFPVWVETIEAVGDTGEDAGDLSALLAQDPSDLPEQYNCWEICRLLSDILRERYLAESKIGAELGFIDVNTFAMMQQANPGVEFFDSTTLMYELRSIKGQAEIESLRKACLLTEEGIVSAAGSIAPGTSVASITEAFIRGVWTAAQGRGLAGELGRINGQPTLGGPGGAAFGSEVSGRGTTVSFDVQVAVSRYHSDIGRTYVVHCPTPDQRRIYHALVEAQARARDALRPGTRICDVYEVALDSMRRAGFRRYSRGHFGHSVGLDPKIEEPPFISASEKRLLSPGMVLSVEAPIYFSQLGPFQIEDMCLITDGGCEVFSSLPRELLQLERELPLSSS
ncbi:MAG: aminopeptidase P family protein [Planctomycetes bacterium]|nr:aminopeptidase P family protein [Planctomycetota bacterium]